jgi:hypothetical protein
MEEDVTVKWIDKGQFELKGLNYDTGKKLIPIKSLNTNKVTSKW